eukprot:scaffold228689_cov31-Tisochrysis_lutea.AAC.1
MAMWMWRKTKLSGWVTDDTKHDTAANTAHVQTAPFHLLEALHALRKRSIKCMGHVEAGTSGVNDAPEALILFRRLNADRIAQIDEFGS